MQGSVFHDLDFPPASLFGGRELLPVESIFKNHPKACLTILSRTLDTKHGYRILKPLLDRRFKVQAMAPDLPFLVKGTPVEAWFRELRKGRKDPRLKNSIGAQSMNSGKHWTRLNNAVLIFDIGHPLLHRFINEFALTFNGNKWGNNGPYLVSRVIKRLFKRHDFNFTILPPMAFYPVDWNKISGFFTKLKTQGRIKTGRSQPASAQWEDLWDSSME
ncbi:Lactosylceramide 4-alpha-galactosyltransferase [Glycine soja]